MELRPIISALFRSKTGALLIAAQVALSLAIVANALYIIRDRLAVAARPSGVADEKALFHISVAPLKDPDSSEIAALQKRDADIIAGVPGVRSVAWTNQVPLNQSGWNMGLSTDTKQTQVTSHTAMYFGPDSLVKTFGLKLVEGRDFTADDVAEINPDTDQGLGNNAIVTKPLAEKLAPNGSVVGKTVYIGTGSDARPIRIVGVVESLQTPWSQVGERGEMSTIMATRYLQGYSTYAVNADPSQRERVMKDVEAALLKADRSRVVITNRSMEEDRFNRYRDDRAVAWMLMTVTGLLLLVTASGIVGMATLWVNQRRKQIGVRRALGARRVDILRYFITENVLITTGGIAAGLVLAVGLNELLVSQLELAKLPIGYLATGAVTLWALGVAAVYGPAWRAASISPAIATRSA